MGIHVFHDILIVSIPTLITCRSDTTPGTKLYNEQLLQILMYSNQILLFAVLSHYLVLDRMDPLLDTCCTTLTQHLIILLISLEEITDSTS